MRKQLVFLLLPLILAGCTNTPNQSAENEGLTLANPTIKLTATPQPSPTAAVQGIATESSPIKPEINAMNATIKTSKGDITVKLYPEAAPNTVKNFEAKAKSDFYKNLTFHRVEDWVIQGGDPDGNGTGGGQMPTELSQVPFITGSLGVARGGNKAISNDAQFFICTTDCAWLTGDYTNFGEVTQGMDVAKSIEVGDKILSVTLE